MMDQVIAAGAALSAFSVDAQHDRLLRISFPRQDGPDAVLLVNTLDAHEELSRCFQFNVGLLSPDAHLPLKDMMGRMVTITLVREDGSLRYFNGYCTQFRLVGADGGFAFYQMILEPWLALAKLRCDCVSFHGKTAMEISEETFANYPERDWRPVLYAELPRITCANQHNESDYNHLHRRWEAAGLHYWYEHSAEGHTLCLGDRSTLAPSIEPKDESGGANTIFFQRDIGAREADGVHDWQARRKVASGSMTLTSFDYKHPNPQRAQATSWNRQGDVAAFEVHRNTGSHGYTDWQDGAAQAQHRMDEQDCRALLFEAKGNNRWVEPGRWFTLGDHFSADAQGPRHGNPPRHSIADRRYLIVVAVHTATNNYLAGAGAPSHYHNRIECINLDTLWRPGLHHNSRPCANPGIQSAIVVGPGGAEIHTDGYGRVKLQFHWDRRGALDDKSSPWIRVMAPAAGRESGHIRLPRVGEEVIVMFLDGNVDHPIILGSAYNAHNMPPWKLPDQLALEGIRCKELGAGQRMNHLVLDSTQGKIQAQLRSDHLHSQLSLGYITRIETNAGRQDERGQGWELRSDGHGVARAAKGLLITTEARPGARNGMTDCGETQHRLNMAAEQQRELSDFAENNGSQDQAKSHADIADALKKQVDAVQGTGKSGSDRSELTAPHIVLASPAGIATTTAGNTHIVSEQHTAITTGKSMSVAVGASLFANVRQTFRLFVHKAGMKLIAAAGDIDMQALTNSINLLAKLDITQTANRITITAKEELVINGGGSYARYAAGGIEMGTTGTFVAHAATHSLPGAKNAAMEFVMPPLKQVAAKGHGIFHLGSEAAAAGRASVAAPYKLYKNGAVSEEGHIDDRGNIAFKHELDANAEYKLELANGQRYHVQAGDVDQEHLVNAGVGYHGYVNPGGTICKEAPTLEQDRVLANPASSTDNGS